MLANKRNLLYHQTLLTIEKLGKISAWQLPQDIRIVRNERHLDFPFASPLSKYQRVNDLMAHSIDACDLVFSETKKNHARVPTEILEMAELIERYFVAENAGEIEDKLAVLMEPFMRKGKDKSHTDANEDRDDSDEVEDFVLS